jgi:hypothetical protein
LSSRSTSELFATMTSDDTPTAPSARRSSDTLSRDSSARVGAEGCAGDAAEEGGAAVGGPPPPHASPSASSLEERRRATHLERAAQ